MTSTRDITFASEAQRKAYIRDCRADYLRENPPAPKGFTLEHDTSLWSDILLGPAAQGLPAVAGRIYDHGAADMKSLGQDKMF